MIKHGIIALFAVLGVFAAVNYFPALMNHAFTVSNYNIKYVHLLAAGVLCLIFKGGK